MSLIDCVILIKILSEMVHRIIQTVNELYNQMPHSLTLTLSLAETCMIIGYDGTGTVSVVLVLVAINVWV